jgi:hypothetical protein
LDNGRLDSGPLEGDVVVTGEADVSPRFTVRQFPGVAQIGASTREQAVRMARAFAQVHRRDLWYSEDGHLRLLEAYRARVEHAGRAPVGNAI